MVVAGVFDVILSVACLCLFLKAESDRCCLCDNDVSTRFLAAEYLYATDPKSCEILCCPAFGSRLCGGIGSLEPFASLIIFRMFRFFVGSQISSMFSKVFTFCQRSNTFDEKEFEPNTEDGTVKDKDESQNDVLHFFESKEGTIAQLWAASLTRFPDLVEKHGPFSGMLLEAMLGIEPSPHENTEPTSKERLEIIKPQSLLTPMKSNFARSLSLGSARSVADSVEDTERAFQRPASVLIRNMRRCQCQWLPLLDSWEDVDVVLTKYELAWFGVNTIDNFSDLEGNQKHGESRRILQDSGGGKGMRLCDVIKGRELMGRLLLDDIESVKIIRFLPGSKNIIQESDVERNQEQQGFTCEYWNEGVKNNDFGSIEQRWSEVTEDVLSIRTPQGTLSLRFLIDLISEEKESDKRDSDQSYKEQRKEEGALLWLKTIIHSQSKEKVNLESDQAMQDDNFGDFIETVRETKTKKFGRSILNRNMYSVKNK